MSLPVGTCGPRAVDDEIGDRRGEGVLRHDLNRSCLGSAGRRRISMVVVEEVGKTL